MYNPNNLKAEITRAGKTQKDVAAELGIIENTFSKKINSGSFGLDEANIMIDMLHIQNPGAVFFGRE